MSNPSFSARQPSDCLTRASSDCQSLAMVQRSKIDRMLFAKGDLTVGPQYLALRDQIARVIETRQLAPGAQLPSERQIQIGSGSARGTVRGALFQLEAEGLIYRRDRSGWYVSPPAVTYDPTRWAGFMTFVAEQGRTPRTELLAKETLPSSVAVAEIFCVSPGTPLHVISRRRSVDDRSVMVERITVHPSIAPDLPDHVSDGSLTHILTGYCGQIVARSQIDIRPCAITRSAAEMLGVKPGTPGLLVMRTSFDAEDRVVEYDEEYWRHDAIRIQVDLCVHE